MSVRPTPPSRAFLGLDVRKQLLLTPVSLKAAALSPEQRAEVVRELAIARRRTDAADALQREGHLVEAMGLARAAAASALAALERLGDDDDDTALGLRTRLQRALEHAQAHPTPELDDEVDDEQALALAELVDLLLDANGFSRMASMDAAERRRTAGLRVTALALAAALMLGMVWYLWLAPQPPQVAASGVLGSGWEHGPEQAIDGDPETAWLLPDNSQGHLDVVLPEPQAIGELKLLNVHRDKPDVRASRDYRVDLYVAGAVARSIEGRWKRPDGQPQWTRHTVDLEGVERIHFEVLTWFPIGGGLAELQWTPRSAP